MEGEEKYKARTSKNHSGAFNHFLPMSYKGNHKRPVTNAIVVTCANGGKLISTATAVINLSTYKASHEGLHCATNSLTTNWQIHSFLLVD